MTEQMVSREVAEGLRAAAAQAARNREAEEASLPPTLGDLAVFAEDDTDWKAVLSSELRGLEDDGSLPAEWWPALTDAVERIAGTDERFAFRFAVAFVRQVRKNFKPWLLSRRASVCGCDHGWVVVDEVGHGTYARCRMCGPDPEAAEEARQAEHLPKHRDPDAQALFPI